MKTLAVSIVLTAILTAQASACVLTPGASKLWDVQMCFSQVDDRLFALETALQKIEALKAELQDMKDKQKEKDAVLYPDLIYMLHRLQALEKQLEALEKGTK